MTRESVLLGDVSLEFRTIGIGPTLLFLHGEDGLAWSEPLLDELAQRMHVIAPHHPGWGSSTRPEHVGDVRDLAAVYREFLDHVNGPVVVMGCSLGAWIAAELAVLRPPNLAGLVLAAPTGIKLGARDEREFADIWAAPFDALSSILYADPARGPDLAASTVSDEDFLYLAVAQEATARYAWAPYMHDPKLRHWLRRIDVPSLVVEGDTDRFALVPDYFAGYAALIGTEGARLRTIADVGHRIEEEAPGALAHLVFEFLDSIDATRSTTYDAAGAS
jgi:pimeloyl-ACP methyl ester carboxylesterase